MKENLTEVVFILDRSGSMSGLEGDTIGGFNSMLNDQKNKDGEVLVSCVLFNQLSEVIYDRVPVSEIRPMTAADYRVGGCTALIDAMGDAIHHIANVHKYAREEDVPAHTMFIITTDGQENASSRWSADRVRQLVKKEQEKYGWEFLFLGANIDAVETARRYGIREDRAVRYECDSEGTEVNFRAMSAALSSMRRGKALNDSWSALIRENYESRSARGRKR